MGTRGLSCGGTVSRARTILRWEHLSSHLCSRLLPGCAVLPRVTPPPGTSLAKDPLIDGTTFEVNFSHNWEKKTHLCYEVEVREEDTWVPVEELQGFLRNQNSHVRLCIFAAHIYTFVSGHEDGLSKLWDAGAQPAIMTHDGQQGLLRV
uniref:Uncharacterized protein n=1 Tax=Myotis myotis TaxID=51298 RepID=A0A7J7Z0W0_MYOMY|nr:hypothetical protein mMyoMyo1_000835 [Myotis myotis]